MIVASAQVDVALQLVRLSSHDENHFAMRLVADDSVYDVRARLL